MITQVFKQWLHKLFGWWPWRKPVGADVPRTPPMYRPLNTAISQEPISRSTNDGVSSLPGVAPLILGQGETSCSTIEEWPERVVQPSASTSENTELPLTSLPTTPALEAINENTPKTVEPSFPEVPPTPTPEQQLEFLQYLVKRGIVNEGFAEGQAPEQYRQQ